MATHIGSGQIYADLQKISAFEIWFAQKFQETILIVSLTMHLFSDQVCPWY